MLSTEGAGDPNPSAGSPLGPVSRQTVPGADYSQPQLKDLPKHGKQSTGSIAASPPKVLISVQL